jgi:hypothetical protein
MGWGWGGNPGCFFFFFSFNKKKIEHQPESNSATSQTCYLRKVSLCPTVLNPVPGSICLEKDGMPFLLATTFQSCLYKPADATAKQHAPHVTPPPTPWEHNPMQPLGRLSPPTKLKSINREL